MKNSKLLFLSFLISLFFVFPVFASPDTGAAEMFFSTLDAFEEEGLIPDDGETIYFGSYSDDLAMLGYYEWLPFFSSDKFVFSAVLSWDTPAERPTSNMSGCGVVFNTKNKQNEVSLSFRMDGMAHLTAYKNGDALTFPIYKYGGSSTKGSIDLTLFVDKGKVICYVDGEKLFERYEMPTFGNTVGLLTMSGSNLDYGVKCDFDDIFVYSWGNDGE